MLHAATDPHALGERLHLRAPARVAVGAEPGGGHGGDEARPVPQRGQGAAVEAAPGRRRCRRRARGLVAGDRVGGLGREAGVVEGRLDRSRTRRAVLSAGGRDDAVVVEAADLRRARGRAPRRGPRRCGCRAAVPARAGSVETVGEAQRRRRGEQRADVRDGRRRRTPGSPREARQSSSSSWVNVWYGPQHTPCSSSALRTSSSVRASNHGLSSAAMRVARAVAVLLLAEVGLERALDRRQVLLDAGGARPACATG